MATTKVLHPQYRAIVLAPNQAKEAVGTVTGRDDLVREGKAQQDKADAQRSAAKKEAAAARGGAKAAEQRQKANQ